MVAILFCLILTALGSWIAWQEQFIRSIKIGQWSLPDWQANVIAGGLTGLLSAWLMLRLSRFVMKRVEAGEAKQFFNAGLTALLGVLLALVAVGILELIFRDGSLRPLLEVLIILFMTTLFFRIGYRRESLFVELFKGARSQSESTMPKLLDTSVIIDGRIGDLVKTGFIEGKIFIPQFVLDELHSIADSSDNLRRRKGRRGLDILGDLRKNPEIEVETLDRDFPEVHGVDRKLIQLAKELKAKIVTTDFNLNKVARVENMPVLNINELANAVKPRFIPGEELEVEVIDKGEEIGQGVGYLDDGTMVVVENGRRFIGRKIPVIVNSSLQTEAGKMLFVRPKVDKGGKWE